MINSSYVLARYLARADAGRALLRDRRAAARRGAAGGRSRAGRRRQGRLRGGGLRPDLRLPEARRRASGGQAPRRAARRHQPRPDLPGRGGRDPRRRGHDRRGGGGDGPTRGPDRGQAVADHAPDRARPPRAPGRRVRRSWATGSRPTSRWAASAGLGDDPGPHRRSRGRAIRRSRGGAPTTWSRSLAELLDGVAVPERRRPMSRLRGPRAGALRRRRRRRRHGGGRGRAGPGPARPLGVLVEKADFAAGTTSRSSKLIHGGLRYLELFDFRLVRESLRERETLARLAPHLVRPLPFLMPVYRDGPRSLDQGAARAPALRPPDAGQADAALRDDERRPGAGARADAPPGGPPGRRLLLRRPAALPGAPLPRERAVGPPRRGARAQLRPGRGVQPARPTAAGRCACGISSAGTSRSSTGGCSSTRPGPGWTGSARGPGVEDRGERILRTTKGIHLLLPRLTERAIYLATERRPDGLRDPLARVLAGRHHRHRLRRQPRPGLGDHARRSSTCSRPRSGLLADPRITEANVAYTYAGVRPLTLRRGVGQARLGRLPPAPRGGRGPRAAASSPSPAPS